MTKGKEKRCFRKVAAVTGVLCIFIGTVGILFASAQDLRVTKWLSSPEEIEFYQEEARIFEKLHPGVKVEMDLVTTGYPEKVIASTAGGEPPDSLYIHGMSQTPSWTEKGIIMPLDEYIDGPNGIDVDDLFAAAWTGSTWKGQRYGYAKELGSQMLYFNKDHFDEVGVSYPDETWRWADLRNAAKRLTTKAGNRMVRFGYAADEINRTFISHVWQLGGRLFNEDYTEPLFPSPESIEAATFQTNLCKEYGIVPAGAGAGGEVGSRKAFQISKSSMTIDGAWMSVAFGSTEGLNYGVAVMPHEKVRAIWADQCYWAVSPYSKNKDLAWEWVKFQSSIESILRNYSFFAGVGKMPTGKAPTWKSLVEDPDWKPLNQEQAISKEELPYTRQELTFWNSGTFFWDYLKPKLEELIYTDKPVKEGLEELRADTIKLLAEAH